MMKAAVLLALTGTVTLAGALGPGSAQTHPEGGFADFVEPAFPFIASILDAGELGSHFPDRNLAVRCIVLLLGINTYACFDTDLLRVAVTWRGEFMTLGTMAQASYHEAGNKKTSLPTILSRPISATGIYSRLDAPST